MPDSMDKIRLKGGPKQYKLAPRPTGVARLKQRAAKLQIDAQRFLAKAPVAADAEALYADALFAYNLATALQPFTS